MKLDKDFFSENIKTLFYALIIATAKGKFLVDGIASDLFKLN